MSRMRFTGIVAGRVGQTLSQDERLPRSRVLSPGRSLVQARPESLAKQAWRAQDGGRGGLELTGDHITGVVRPRSADARHQSMRVPHCRREADLVTAQPDSSIAFGAGNETSRE